MRKVVIILSVFALIASSCGNKKQAGNGNIPADSIQIINETCLVLKIPETQDFVNDESQEALSDFSFYSSETNARFKNLGINAIDANKRYLSFALNSGKNHIIDTKEQSIFEAFLYKEGKTPIPVDIVNNDWKSIADYLQMNESEIIERIEANDEAENQTKKKVKYYFKNSNETVVFFDDGTAYESSNGDVEINREGYVFLDENLTERTWESAPYREFTDFVVIGKIERFDFFDDFGWITPDWKIINYHLIGSRRMQITNFETNTEKIAKSDIQNINETCLIIIRPKFENSSEEEGDPAADWDYYAYETSKRYEEKGIKTVYAEKQYLRFTIADDEKIVIDTKKEQNGKIPPSALLHRKGYIPIMISISGESDEGNKMIEEYLR